MLPVYHGRSEGSRLLLAVLRQATTRETARRLGVDHSSVVKWVSGARSPSWHARVAIARVLGIDPHAWDRPPVLAILAAPELVTRVTAA